MKPRIIGQAATMPTSARASYGKPCDPCERCGRRECPPYCSAQRDYAKHHGRTVYTRKNERSAIND